MKRFSWFEHIGADASHRLRETPDNMLPHHAFQFFRPAGADCSPAAVR
jgi:hypothetical protein